VQLGSYFAEIIITSFVEEKKTNSDFFNQVYEVVKLIPPGRVTSYGAIAKFLSSAKSSRMVGWAMNASHGNPEIPAHRVVNRNGLLTGKHFFVGMSMQERLEREGILIKDDQIQDFQKHFWDPSEQIGLQ
jgi:methylated-DNA-protein-cysteine methyltransferase-like protein